MEHCRWPQPVPCLASRPWDASSASEQSPAQRPPCLIHLCAMNDDPFDTPVWFYDILCNIM
jgi:hypothetical protein